MTSKEMAELIIDAFDAVDSYGMMTPVGAPAPMNADAKLAALVELLDGDPDLGLLEALKEIDVKRNPHLYSEPDDAKIGKEEVR